MAIYILTKGVPTDIVIPVKTAFIDWSLLVQYQHAKSAHCTHNYIAMAWGDNGFFLQTPTWADLKFSVADKVAMGWRTTAMHTTYHRTVTERESCNKIMTSRAQNHKLVAHISDSHPKNANKRFTTINIHENYNQTDSFYEAKVSYSRLTACNSRANNTLKVTGTKACLWTAVASTIFEK